MTAAIRDLLVVVEHEDEVLVDRFQVVEKSRDDRIHNIRARLTQRTQRGGAAFRRCVPDRVNDVAPERDRVVVPESSETQAKGRASTSRHCARRVVFPNPGGAANRTSLGAESRSTSVQRARGRASRGARTRSNFHSKKAPSSVGRPERGSAAVNVAVTAIRPLSSGGQAPWSPCLFGSGRVRFWCC